MMLVNVFLFFLSLSLSIFISFLSSLSFLCSRPFVSSLCFLFFFLKSLCLWFLLSLLNTEPFSFYVFVLSLWAPPHLPRVFLFVF